MDVLIPTKILRKGVKLPKYQTDGSSAVDLQAFGFSVIDKEAKEVTLDFPMGITMQPGSRVIAKTGLAVAVPDGYELQIRPRSGLAIKVGLTVLNSPGTIDSDYRGEIGVILHNTDPTGIVQVHIGDRVAQLVIQKVSKIIFIKVDELPETDRGTGGFGSTGK